MAWRIADNVVRGEIDNRIPGIIKGEIYLEGMKEPVTLELEGDCCPDLAGRHFTFKNMLPAKQRDFEGFGTVQCGEAGEMTADRMVRAATVGEKDLEECISERRPIPSRWSDELYLEWYSTNGRVLIEGSSFACKLTPAQWSLSEEEVRRRRWRQEREMDPFLDDGGDDEVPFEGLGKETEVRPVLWRTEECQVGDVKVTHPLVTRCANFMVTIIFEKRDKKLYVDEAWQNQPLDSMIESTNRATIRLATAMAKASHPTWEGDRAEIVHELKRARWAFADASENAGLANHMGSADAEWLASLRKEFASLRLEVKRLIQRYESGEQEEKPF